MIAESDLAIGLHLKVCYLMFDSAAATPQFPD
jgi:hypothetical protein